MLGLCIILLSISSTLAWNLTNFLFLNDDPCMVRPTLIDINPVEHKYPFVITLDKRSGSCNALFPKICATEKKDIYVKLFHMITNKNEAKQITKYISYDYKCKFDSRTCYSNQNGIIKHVNVNVKIIISTKMVIIGTLTHVFVKIVFTLYC